MAEFQPNSQQRKFLESNNTNLLVSASAGSGKTSTMIQKLLKILSEELQPITSLFVVTYTNAAASEIKLKLYNELSKLIVNTDDINKKDFLKNQLDNIGNAEIGTLHAICKKLIVKYFYELEQSPDFSLISDKEQKYLIDMAVNNVFSSRIVSNDEEFFELYDCYNSNRNDLKLKKMVLQLYDYKVSKIDYYSWKYDFLNTSYNEDINSNYATSYLLEYYQKKILGFSRQLLGLKKIASDKGFDKYFGYLDARYQFINEFSVASDFETAVKIVGNLNLPIKPRITSNSTAIELDFDEKIDYFGKTFNEVINKLKEDIISSNPDEIKGNISVARKNVEKLLEIVECVEKEYSHIKKSKNVLDFNDLEDYMIKLLENNTIRESLKNQYKYIFVDEYQDINNKQEYILMNLVSDNNYYMIGDVKQSIYAFRQSSPKIFVDKYNNYATDNGNGNVINFNINYRSDRNILEFANNVFDNIITRNTIGIDYKSDARFDSQKEFNGTNVTLDIIREDEENTVDDRHEAKLIVEKIVDIIKTKKPDGTYYEFGDIAIILRSRGDFVGVLCDMLNQHQIPVKASINSDFFNTSEVALLRSVLRLVSNYKDDIAMSVVLKNLFDVSENDLISIRNYDENVALYEAVSNYSSNDEIKKKIKRCFDFIESSRLSLAHMTIREYLTMVVDEFNIVLKVKIRPNGIERANNINEFLRICDNSNYEYNIDSLLNYLDIVSKENTPKKIGAGNNAVEICTIHHSKGLEYPVVILGRLGQKFQLNKETGDIIINGKFGVGLKSIDSKNRILNETVIRSACKLDNKKSEIDEEIRLLYVAMTRAKEKLYLLGKYNVSKLAINKRKDIYNTNTPFDMIFKSVADADIIGFENKDKLKINEGSFGEASVNLYNTSELEEDEIKKTNPIILDKINTKLLEKLLYVYRNKPNKNCITIKNTVTNILREESDYENLNFSPQNLDPSDKVPNLDFLKLGTAYHTVMQEIKFTENYLEIQDLIGQLVFDGKITKELAKLIHIDEILKCISVMKDLVLNAKKVYKEKQFLLCENYNKLLKSTDNNTKVIVQGVIDIVVVREDGVCLIDYKTNRGMSEKDLAKEYALQLSLYAHAFREATGLPVTHKFLYSFKLGKLIEIQ